MTLIDHPEIIALFSKKKHAQFMSILSNEFYNVLAGNLKFISSLTVDLGESYIKKCLGFHFPMLKLNV